MNKLEFIRKLDARSPNVNDSTAALWFHLLSWVVSLGYADTADSPDFLKHVQEFRQISVQTIGKHLGRMADAGFLQAHRVRRKLPTEVKADLNASLTSLIFGGGASSMPTSFKRYTLPGVSCPMVFRSFDRAEERERTFAEMVMAQGMAK